MAQARRGKSEHHRARCRVTPVWLEIHAGGKLKGFSTESATENQTAKIPQGMLVRVKRCGKSAPREAQATRHGKPHRVQGQIGNRGAARSKFRESETGFGYRSLRQMILSVRKGADKIRLTALLKPTSDLRLANYSARGALLPHLFTLTGPLARTGGIFSVALSVETA